MHFGEAPRQRQADSQAALIRPGDLDRPTPCTRWSLLALLRHMDDSLAVMGEAAQTTALGLAPVVGPEGAEDLLASIRQRACTLVGQWSVGAPDAVGQRGQLGQFGQVALGEAVLARETLGLVGALEITLHGWDVARACGADRPSPPGLALELWAVARDHITQEDRPSRFAPVVEVPDWASAETRLLAQVGRRP